MDNNLPVWAMVLIAILTTIGGGFGAWIVTLYSTRNKHQLETNKQDSDLRIEQNEQAVKFYKEILDRIREDVINITKDMNKLEQDHINCREQNASFKADIRALEKDNVTQKLEIDGLKKEILDLRNQLYNKQEKEHVE